MKLFKRAILVASSALLASCASIAPQTVSIDPPAGAQEVLRLDASGEQIFRCARDTQGWFWHFEAPNAYLFDPIKNQAVAKHGYHFSFVHNDGSKLVTRIIRYRPQTENLTEALFAVTESTSGGVFSGVKYIQRLNTRGGLPTQKCSEAKKGHVLRVPFEAQFVFYK